MFSFWNLNNDTATVIAVGSRLFVYMRNSKGPSFETCGTPCLAVSQFGKVCMCIVYPTMHLVDQHIIIYV